MVFYMRAKAVIRIRIITGMVLIIAAILLVRLYILQIEKHEVFAAQANQQYVHTVQNVFNRGSIFLTTKDGERVSAASVRSGFVLAINPQQIKDPEYYFNQLESYIDIDKETFVHRANLPERTYVEIANRVLSQQAQEVRELELPGVMLYRNQWRYYPGDSLAAQTIGFVAHGSDPGEPIQGRYGLERQYEHVLGRNNHALAVNLFAEIFGHISDVQSEERTNAPGHVVTTLEPTVSRMLDNVLYDLHHKYTATHTGGIIMDPQTGAVRAMTHIPNFNNNDRRGASIMQFRNPLVENVYEFGSIVKAITIAAGIDSDTVTPQSRYYDTGAIEIDRFTIRNFDGRARGDVTMQDVLNNSLNTGVSYIVDQMGTANFRQYLIDLGFAEPSGVDLPNDAVGLTGNLNSPRRVEYATASFGQGVALTPMAMIRALATLGNGGSLVTPHIVKAIEYEDGHTESMVPEATRGVFTAETSDTISRMLTNTVDEALRGGGVALPNHTVGAKTGTAQIPNPETGGYYDDRFLHSFFGYFPAYEPEFIVLLYTIDPRGVQYASESLTDPFMDITNFLINYYEVLPDR